MSLQQFVEDVLNLSNGSWTCPGGNSKQYKTDDVDIRWYPTTQSITLNGKLKNEIKEKLTSLVSISDQVKNSKQQEEAIDLNHNGDHPSNTSVENDPTLSLETIKGHLETLFKEVHANRTAIKIVKSDLDCLRSKNLRLTDENVELKNENGKLKERLDNLSYIY